MRVPEGWKVKTISNILDKVSRPVEVEEKGLYREIGIRSHGKGIFYKENVLGEELGNKRVYWIEPNCFILNIVFAWEQAIGKTTENEVGMIGSHRFPMYKSINNKVVIDYIVQYFLTQMGKDVMEYASPGGAGRNRTLGQDRFKRSLLIVPSNCEQQKIVNILNMSDNIINLQKKLILEKEKQKKWIRQNLITGKKRLSGFDGEWHKVELKDVFDYIQPTAYLVSSTDYKDEFKTPVLTAGKTFVLGYTNETDGIFEDVPVVIFDDFTTASKFVDFNFKVKSSAMKILKSLKGYNIIFVYTALQNIKFQVGGHERHWISKFSYLPISVPSLKEQNAIANILFITEKEIELLQQKLVQLQIEKKAMMQLLLSGIVRAN